MAAAAIHDQVLVADDDPDSRATIRKLLERTGWRVVEAADGEEALEFLADPPALVLLEVCLPKVNGYEVCAEIRQRFGERLPIIFLSGERTAAVDRTAGLLVGGDDYIVKPFDPAELLARVKSVLRGRGIRLPAQARPNGAEELGLTPRELDVLARLVDGMTTAEMAGDLVISPRTVGTHVQNIFEKLDVHSRAQVVAYAHRHGLAEPPGTRVLVLSPP